MSSTFPIYNQNSSRFTLNDICFDNDKGKIMVRLSTQLSLSFSGKTTMKGHVVIPATWRNNFVARFLWYIDSSLMNVYYDCRKINTLTCFDFLRHVIMMSSENLTEEKFEILSISIIIHFGFVWQLPDINVIECIQFLQFIYFLS